MPLESLSVSNMVSDGLSWLTSAGGFTIGTVDSLTELYPQPYPSMLPSSVESTGIVNTGVLNTGVLNTSKLVAPESLSSTPFTLPSLNEATLDSAFTEPSALTALNTDSSQNLQASGFPWLDSSDASGSEKQATNTPPHGDDAATDSLFNSIFNKDYDKKEFQDAYTTPLVDTSPNNSIPQQLDNRFSLENMQPSLLMHEPSLILVIAVLLEMLIPIPQRFKFSGLQTVFNQLAAKVNLPNASNSQRAFAGVFLPLIFLVFFEGVVLFLDVFTGFDSLISLVVMIYLLELRYPQESALQIYEPLARQDNEKTKEVLYPFVLREVKKLSALGLSKAASEGCILRIFNGWFAVMIWFLIGGIELAVLMQCLATMSRAFNFKIPQNYMFSRIVFIMFELMLAIPALVLGLVLTISTNPLRPWSCGVKGLQSYPAPVTGFVLGAVGGALNVSLGGPRYYFGRLIRLPKVGGDKEPQAETILQSMRKIRLCGIVMLVLAIIFDINFM